MIMISVKEFSHLLLTGKNAYSTTINAIERR